MTSTTSKPKKPGPASIADPFLDLLSALDERGRQGFVQRLAAGYYEGWRPTRAEVATLVALETGHISETEYLAMQRSPSIPEDAPSEAADAVITSYEDVPADGEFTDDSDVAAQPASTDPSRPWLQRFRVDCGELAPPLRFITHGLSDGGWVRRGDQQARLIFLTYELISPDTTEAVTFEPVFFTAPIRCLPAGVALQTIDNDQTSTHTVGPASIFGSRGPWLIPADTRQLKFLIYAQSPRGRHHRHPAGALGVDIHRDQAEWLPVTGRRAARKARRSSH